MISTLSLFQPLNSEVRRSEQREQESSVVWQLLLVVTGFLTSIMIARALGPAGKGLFTLSLSLASVFAALLHSALGLTNARYSGTLKEANSVLIGNTIAFTAIVGGFGAMLAGLSMTNLMARYYPLIGERLWVIVLLAILPLVLQELSNSLVFGMNELRRLGWTLLARDLLMLLSVLLLMFFGLESTYGVISIWLILMAIGGVLMLTQAIQSSNSSPFVDLSILSDSLRYGSRGYLSQVTTNFKTRIDPILIGLFLSAGELGIYSIAMLFSSLIPVSITILTPVLKRKIALIDFQDDRDEDAMSLRISFGFAAISAAFMVVFGHWLLLLPGKGFAQAYQSMVLLLPGALFGIYTILLAQKDDALTGSNLPALALLVNIGIAVFLIPKFGVLGAAVSSSVVNSGLGLYSLQKFASENGFKPSEIVIPTREDLELIFRRDI